LKAATATFLLLVLVLAGCAPQVAVRDPEAVSRVWSVLHPDPAETERMTARFSLQVATPERTGRLLGQLWGYPASVVRLDLSSGTGASVAMIREAPELWLAYLPSENKAYHNPRARAGLDLFQIPVPFDVRQIASLLAGDLAPIAGDAYARVRNTAQGRIRYEFRRGDVAALEAAADLGVLVLTGRAGWTLECEKPYADLAFPDRILFDKFTFSSPRDGRAVIRVKSLEAGGEWTSGDLDLALPPDVQWLRITNTPQFN
jgi:hypothetical protein